MKQNPNSIMPKKQKFVFFDDGSFIQKDSIKAVIVDKTFMSGHHYVIVKAFNGEKVINNLSQEAATRLAMNIRRQMGWRS